MVTDLGKRIETVLRENDGAPGLREKNFRAAANGVRIIDHHDLQPSNVGGGIGHGY